MHPAFRKESGSVVPLVQNRGVEAGGAEGGEDGLGCGAEPVAGVVVQLTAGVEEPKGQPCKRGAQFGQGFHLARAERDVPVDDVGFDQDLAAANLKKAIDGEKRMAQVVKEAQEKDQIKLAQVFSFQIVNGASHITNARRKDAVQAVKPGFLRVFGTEGDNVLGAAALALEAEAAMPGADVEDAQAGQVVGQAGAAAEVGDGIVAGREDPLIDFPALVPEDGSEELDLVEARRR